MTWQVIVSAVGAATGALALYFATREKKDSAAARALKETFEATSDLVDALREESDRKTRLAREAERRAERAEKDNAILRRANAQLIADNSDMKETNRLLLLEVGALTARVEHLERKIE